MFSTGFSTAKKNTKHNLCVRKPHWLGLKKQKEQKNNPKTRRPKEKQTNKNPENKKKL